MLGRSRLHGAAAAGLLLGACAQIIGIDSLEDEDVDDPRIIPADGGSAGDGGNGTGGGDGGNPSSPEAGAGGTGGAAGAAGDGMAGEGGGGGAGGAVPSCSSVTEITATYFSIDPSSDPSTYYYYYLLTNSVGSSLLPDFLEVSFYAPLGGGGNRMVNLAGAPENNYATCSH